jgi:hypothetical protein
MCSVNKSFACVLGLHYCMSILRRGVNIAADAIRRCLRSAATCGMNEASPGPQITEDAVGRIRPVGRRASTKSYEANSVPAERGVGSKVWHTCS